MRGLRGALLALMMAAAPAFAEGVLYVSPLRVEVKPGEQTTTLSVTNKAAITKRYNVTSLDQVMNADGVTETVDNFEFSAKRMMRFMPRRIVLEPGQRQLVRVMIRRPGGLPDGDYHTHLLFEEEQPSVSASVSETLDKGFKLNMGAIYSVAIPVVIQHGDVTSTIALGDVSVVRKAENGAPNGYILAVVNRGGNAEATGFLTVKSADDKMTDLVSPRRVRVYREANTVNLRLPLNEFGASYKGSAKVLFKRDNLPDSAVIGERVLEIK